jgi:outer membrane protein OmpA-like peptidoglycan-associated protein
VENDIQESPDALREIVMFYPIAPKGIASWEFVIRDSSEHLVQSFTGQGACPERIAWFGVELNGAVARDGFYQARLTVRSPERRSASRAADFSFMTLPEIASLSATHLALQEDSSKVIVRLPDLIFSVGSATFSLHSSDVMEAVANLLKAYSNRPVLVLGYTDNTGGPQYNLSLSERRAQAVYAALLERDVAPQRIRYRGLGDSHPMADNFTAAGRALNRRVEVWLSKRHSV